MRVIFIFVLMFWISAQTVFAAPAAKDFGTLPSVYDAAISPDGTRVAMFYNIDGTYGISVMPTKGKAQKARVVLLGKGVKPKWLKWANNEYVLASIWQSGETQSVKRKGSNIETKGVVYTSSFLYSINANSMKSKVLVKPRDIFRQFNDVVIDFLDDDPDHILMAYSNTNAFAPGIRKVHVVSGKSQIVKGGNEKIQFWYTDLTGTPRVGQGRKDNTSAEKWYLKIRNAADDTWRDYSDYPGLEPDVDIFGFTKNPNEMIIGAYNGKDTRGLYIYDLEAKKQTRKIFHDDTYDAQNVVQNLQGDVIGASLITDSKEIVLLDDYRTALDRIKAQTPGYSIDYIDQSRDGDTILFKASHAYDPGLLMAFDSRTGKSKPLVKYRENLPSSEMGMVIPVNYPARDNFQVPAYVTLPPVIADTAQIKSLPFIILPHGGPYARSSERFDYLAQFFASRGFGVLQMNFRGSAGYGKSYEDAGRKNWIVMQEDVEDGTRWLIKNGYADPERVCIAGWSYGGYAALMGAIKNPELYACSISMAGVTDIQDMIQDMKKYRFGRLDAQNFVLQGFEDKDAIRENSPTKRADEYSVPLFLAHGRADQRVHYDQYTRMKRALKKSSAKVTFMDFKDEDHFLSNQANRQKFFIGLDKFLTETVGKSEYRMK